MNPCIFEKFAYTPRSTLSTILRSARAPRGRHSPRHLPAWPLLFLLAILSPAARSQTLTNGFDQPGTLALGTTNSYTFYATNGDAILLRAGAPTFRPLITLYAPNGTPLAAGAGAGSSSIDASITPLAAATNGLFTVRVSSFYGNGSGAYSLSLARIPAGFTVAPTDEGGTMINGAAHSGTSSLGDIDLWSIAASAGDRMSVRIGATGFRPHLMIYGPNGAQIDVGAGAGSSDTDALVEAVATSNATFTVVVQSYYANGTGPYTIHLAKSTGAFVVSPGDDGGDLINGAATTGQIAKGDLDLWRFDANAGDNIALRIGSPGLRPRLQLYGPNGALLLENAGGSSSGTDARVYGTVTNTGTFLLVAQSYYYSRSSSYTLTLARVPGAYAVSPGDEGGALGNGLTQAGTNSLGDLDVWTFPAQAGDNIALRVGAPDYRPWLQLYGPNGALIADAPGGGSSHRDVSIFTQVTNSGTYTVLQQSYYYDGTGPYTLNFGQFPGAFTVSPGDEGGRLTNGVAYDGAIALGDLDLWSFAACKGYPFTIVCEKLSGSFTPRVRLYSRTGGLLATAQHASTVTLNYPGTNTGSYTLMIDGAGVNDSGAYRLTGYGIADADALSLCPPLIAGDSVNLTGFGGAAGGNFVLLTTTEITRPMDAWTPLWTNQFDAFGAFDYTNQFGVQEPRRFFRVLAR